MKKQNKIIALIALLTLFQVLTAQKLNFVCQETGPAQYRNMDDRGGVYITSEGTINTLVIFVQFKDDLDSTAGWPTYIKDKTMKLPPWASEFGGPGIGITKYFETMSNGKLILNTTIYPKLVIPNLNGSEYESLHKVNYEILGKLDEDPDFSYSTYDNWSGPQPGSDGIADLIFIVYRSFPNSLIFGQKWTGNSSIWLPINGYYSATDDINISGSFEKGSGIQLRAASNGLEYSVFQAVHEFGHKLFGAGHIKYGLANLTLMGASPVWNSSRGMCAWERERLGWVDYIVKDQDETFEIQDYMNEDVAIKIKLPGIEREYFILENRQKLITEYDLAGDKGIYIYHVKGSDQTLPELMDIECADGNYQWSFDKSTLKVTRLNPDPYLGKDEMNYHVEFDSNNDGEPETYGCFTDGGYYKDAAWGDSNDAFDEKYNNVFSPVSNPPSTNGVNHPFTLEILENINGSGVYRVRLHYSNAFTGIPAKPYGLEGYAYTYGEFGSTSARGRLKWSHFDYSDHDEYEVYRAISNSGEPDLSEYSYVTNAIGVSMSPKLSELDYGDNNKIYYRIKAKDKQGKRSMFSESITDWAPPSTPTLYIARSMAGHPVVSWSAPESSDMDVYLRKRDHSIWEDPIKVTGLSYYEDTTIDWPLGHIVNESDFYFYAYKQRRADLQSPQSIILNAWGEGGDWMFKDGANIDGLPTVYSLSQNYPNPFNPSSVINYQLPNDTHVQLIVFDILGKKVVELINENLKAGYYKVNFDGGNLTSGIYIYRLIAGDFIESKKMLLAK